MCKGSVCVPGGFICVVLVSASGATSGFDVGSHAGGLSYSLWDRDTPTSRELVVFLGWMFSSVYSPGGLDYSFDVRLIQLHVCFSSQFNWIIGSTEGDEDGRVYCYSTESASEVNPGNASWMCKYCSCRYSLRGDHSRRSAGSTSTSLQTQSQRLGEV